MISCSVSQTEMKIRTKSAITEGLVGATCQFIFSPEWDGLAKTVVFESLIAKSIVLTSRETTIPPEVLDNAAGYKLKISIVGKNPEGTIVIPTIWGIAGTIRPSGASDEYEESQWEPTPDYGAQLMVAVDQAVANSANAVEVAESVRADADAGEFNGEKGDQGESGVYVGDEEPPEGNTANVWVDTDGDGIDLEEFVGQLVEDSPTITDIKDSIDGVSSDLASFKVIPIWNIAKGGIYIDGTSVKTNANGFGIMFRDGRTYFIAPADRSTSYSFPSMYSTDGYDVLVIDTEKLTNLNGRNEPNAVLSVIHCYDSKVVIPSKYIVVAFYWKTYWSFCGAFKYFEQSSSAPSAEDYPVVPYWNIAKGGIYIDGNNIVVNENGFGVRYEDSVYYIAPTDRTTITRFAGIANYSAALVIDKTKLTTPNARVNPSTVLSVINISDSYKIDPKYIIVAVYYKTFWDFYGVFSYFKQFQADSTKPINENIMLFNLASHRGDSAKVNNTIDAFETAYSKGFRYAECDLRFTADNVCVLYHDETLNGTAISALTSSALPDYIPTLESALLWAKKRKCVLELDCAGRLNSTQINAVYDLCNSIGMLHSVVFTAYATELAYLTANGKTDASVCVSFLNSTPTESLIASIPESVKHFLYAMVSLNKQYATKALISYAHGAGYGVKVWTVTSASEASSLADIGADTLLCDASELWSI